MAHTKQHAAALAEYIDPRVPLDTPVNIHFTGCPHSCAQHYMGDIGLLGTRVEAGEEMIEAYHVFVGGGYGAEQGIGRELFRNVLAAEVPGVVERLLLTYLENRATAAETFREFTSRIPAEHLKQLSEQPAAVAENITRGILWRSDVSVAVPMLPESAPFTPAQRAWLNGFFAGLLGGPRCSRRRSGAACGPHRNRSERMSLSLARPALGLDERMKLAEGGRTRGS
jgi:dissimilatory sulfite reductase (desulfoviridin) alpha/beta subunit